MEDEDGVWTYFHSLFNNIQTSRNPDSFLYSWNDIETIKSFDLKQDLTMRKHWNGMKWQKLYKEEIVTGNNSLVQDYFPNYIIFVEIVTPDLLSL